LSKEYRSGLPLEAKIIYLLILF